MGLLDALKPDTLHSAAACELDADVRAELEHHLAAAADELAAQGLSIEEAHREARRRFGDPDTVRRACLRTRLGAHLMHKRLHLSFTILLSVAVVALFGWNLMTQREAALTTERLHMEMAEHLAALESLRALQSPEPVDQLVFEVGDRVQILDEYNPDRNTLERVGRDGQVLVPDVGWVMLAGLTRAEAEALVTEASRTYYVQSQVRLKVDPLLESSHLGSGLDEQENGH